MRNQRGFTLVELLAVIVILAILSLVALPAVSLFQNQTDEAYYASLERTVLFAGRNYYNDRMSLLPREVGDQNRVSLDELVRLDYLEQPVSTSNKACIGNVDVRKTERGTYEYSVCLKCDQYVNNDTCNFNETVTDGGTESDYLTLDQTYYEVPRGEPFVAGYAKYYHNGELVKSDIAPNPSWIDTSVLETYTLTYTYKNLSVTATVRVVDVTPPGATTVEMRTDSLTGAIYTSGWTNHDVYQIFSSQDDDGGSGIRGYAISLVNRPSDSTSWTLIQGNYITQKDLVVLQGKSGVDFSGIVYVWAVDNYDNFGPVTSYKLSVDQTAPAVPSITNPTNGNWTNQDIYLTLNSSDAMSGISYYQYSYDNNAWNTYADSAKETYITTPYSVERNQAAYLRVCDYAGNCSNSASTMIRIDKTVPTISYNLVGGTYNSTKSVTVTGSDSNFSYMNVHVYKNGVYDGSRSVNNKTTNTHTVSLDSDGTWTVYTKVYDQAGNKHTMGPDNGDGWYYQTYTIVLEKVLVSNGTSYIQTYTCVGPEGNLPSVTQQNGFLLFDTGTSFGGVSSCPELFDGRYDRNRAGVKTTIDLTPYKKLTFELDYKLSVVTLVGNAASGEAYAFVYVMSNNSVVARRCFLQGGVNATRDFSGRMTYTCDISDLNGVYIVNAGVSLTYYRGAAMRLYSLKLTS